MSLHSFYLGLARACALVSLFNQKIRKFAIGNSALNFSLTIWITHDFLREVWSVKALNIETLINKWRGRGRGEPCRLAGSDKIQKKREQKARISKFRKRNYQRGKVVGGMENNL